MKKTISLLLVLVMCLSLCACGGDNDTSESKRTITDTLCSESWKDVTQDNDSIDFKPDGTGVLTFYGNKYPMTWKVENNMVVVDYVRTLFGNQQIVLDIEDSEEVIKLQSTTGDSFYVLTSNYDSAKAEWTPPQDEVLVEIINNDGETELLSGSELLTIYNNNEVMFKKKYFEAPVVVVSEIEEIHGPTNYNGHKMNAYVQLKGGWIVEAERENVVENLSVGDTVKISGNIFSAFGFEWSGHIYIYIVNGHTTSITPYTE